MAVEDEVSVQKKIIFVLILLVLVVCAMSIYFLISNFRLRQSLKFSQTGGAKKSVGAQQYQKLEQDLKRDLEEKYQADMVSYQAMIKRLDQEKNKQQELKAKIQELEKNTK